MSAPAVTRLVLLLALLAPPALAQAPPDQAPPGAVASEDLTIGTAASPGEATAPALSLDRRALLAIYAYESPAAGAVFRSADWTSTRVFILAAPLAGAAAMVASGGDLSELGPAWRLGLSQVGATAITYAGKHGWQRPRPYLVEEGVVSRSPGHPASRASYSFPSGHAALSFSIATSLSLSYPEWYVVAPAMGYAAVVSLSRAWLGVHYPSDILVGAAVGAGVATLVHLAGDALTPGPFRPGDGPPEGIVVPLVILSW